MKPPYETKNVPQIRVWSSKSDINYQEEHRIMANLFLDIETAPDFQSAEEYFSVKADVESEKITANSPEKAAFWKYKMGALNPFDGRVTLITYQINNGSVNRLKEWETNEASILKQFFNLLQDLNKYRSIEDHLRIIGHNILNFDIYFLYERMTQLMPDSTKWVYQWLIRKPEIIDLLQLHLPLNNLQTRGLKHNVLAHAYGLNSKTTMGADTISNYFNKDYEKIIQYSTEEFIYPQIYDKIVNDGLVTKERLAEAIRYVSEGVK